MKKLIYIPFLFGLLLVGCSQDKEMASNETKTSEVTPEKAKEAFEKISETAKKDEVIKEMKVEETEEQVTIKINFAETTSNEEKGLLVFNYTALLQAAYPDKKINLEVDKE